jgi:DNA-directed RNA polymerase sigma subunit (sigma70/sigma32)
MATIKHTFSNRLTTSNAPSETNYTLQEIADMMDITKERVRQIEAKALNKLRQRLRSLGHDR